MVVYIWGFLPHPIAVVPEVLVSDFFNIFSRKKKGISVYLSFVLKKSYVYLGVCPCVCRCSRQGGAEEDIKTLELGLQAVMSHPRWKSREHS